MGIDILPAYGAEFAQLRGLYEETELGQVASGLRQGIIFVEAESKAPLRVITIEDDPAATAVKRQQAAEHLELMSIAYHEVMSIQEPELYAKLVADMNDKRCHD